MASITNARVHNKFDFRWAIQLGHSVNVCVCWCWTIYRNLNRSIDSWVSFEMTKRCSFDDFYWHIVYISHFWSWRMTGHTAHYSPRKHINTITQLKYYIGRIVVLFFLLHFFMTVFLCFVCVISGVFYLFRFCVSLLSLFCCWRFHTQTHTQTHGTPLCIHIKWLRFIVIKCVFNRNKNERETRNTNTMMLQQSCGAQNTNLYHRSRTMNDRIILF